MDVKEKRERLYKYCGNQVSCDFCMLFLKNSKCDGAFEEAPDEMVEKWYMTAFPEPVAHSDEQRVFSTGAVRDSNEGKGRMDLLPWAAIIEVSRHCQRGAEHYGEHYVDKGILTSCLLDRGMRHIAKHMAGWTDEEHLVAAAWNLLWAVEMTLKHPELVDTPWMPEMEDD